MISGQSRTKCVEVLGYAGQLRKRSDFTPVLDQDFGIGQNSLGP
jgi:hypothetical protein